MKRLLVIAALCIAGCGGEPRVDTTTDARAIDTVKAVGNALPDENQGAFMTAIMRIRSKNPEAPDSVVFKPWHGMNGQDVLRWNATETAKAAK